MLPLYPHQPSTRGALQRLLAQQRLHLLTREEQTLRQLAVLYQTASDRILREQIAPLLGTLVERADHGEPMTFSQALRWERLRTLRTQLAAEVDALGARTVDAVTRAQRASVLAGLRDATELMHAAVGQNLGARLSQTWNRVPSEAVNAFIGAASDGSPLADLFAGFGQDAAQRVTSSMATGMALGQHPTVIARQVASDLQISRNRALVISRTETLRAYRGAALENYRANSDVVGGWTWSCANSANTCAACLFMDGSEHALDEDMDSHISCRCAMLPMTRSYEDLLGGDGMDGLGVPGVDFGADGLGGDDLDADQATVPITGAMWLAQQSAAVQDQVLGRAAGSLYRDGSLTLGDLVGTRHDARWGTSIYVKSLKELGISPKGK